jgi:hypothetical protein
MSTVKIKSTELVRKFADIKSLVLETGTKIVVEEYNKPVLVIYPSNEAGEAIMPDSPDDIKKLEKLRDKLKNKRIKVSAVNLT